MNTLRLVIIYRKHFKYIPIVTGNTRRVQENLPSCSCSFSCYFSFFFSNIDHEKIIMNLSEINYMSHGYIDWTHSTTILSIYISIAKRRKTITSSRKITDDVWHWELFEIKRNIDLI